jgi:hypothetical protein
MTAYNIAKQIDDSFPPGVVIREAPLGVRDDYTSLAWLAGQLAYKSVGKPGDAARLFRLYGEAARSAQTRTKGFYWAGRAALAAGDAATANAHFADAAQHYDQFYGQLRSNGWAVRSQSRCRRRPFRSAATRSALSRTTVSFARLARSAKSGHGASSRCSCVRSRSVRHRLPTMFLRDSLHRRSGGPTSA